MLKFEQVTGHILKVLNFCWDHAAELQGAKFKIWSYWSWLQGAVETIKMEQYYTSMDKGDNNSHGGLVASYLVMVTEVLLHCQCAMMS